MKMIFLFLQKHKKEGGGVPIDISKTLTHSFNRLGAQKRAIGPRWTWDKKYRQRRISRRRRRPRRRRRTHRTFRNRRRFWGAGRHRRGSRLNLPAVRRLPVRGA